MGEIAELINYSISTGQGIPIQVITTTQTNWSQFGITIFIGLISSFFIFMLIWNNVLKPSFSALMIKFSLSSIKKKTGRNILFIKHTSSGLFDASMINQNTLLDLNNAMKEFNGKPFDLVLHTPGGEIFSSMFISRLIKNYPGQIRVIVPYYAMSGGTLLALSGNEIFMSDTACLGPVDPQLGNLFRYGSAKSWDKIMKLKGKKAEDQSISFAFMGSQYTKSIARYIDSMLVGRMQDSQRKAFVNFLTSGDVEHAYPLTRIELAKFGLPVKHLNDDVTKSLNKVISSKLYEGVYFI